MAATNTRERPLAGFRPADRGTQPDYLYPPYASTVKRAPSQPLVRLPWSLSEVTGPLFGFERIMANDFDLTKQHAGEPIGERIVVSGRVLDANARPVANTLVEIWQANAAGRYAHPEDRQSDKPLDPHFRGFGRCATDAEGRFRFTTVKPGPVPGRGNSLQAPHINVLLFSRGLLIHLHTRIYFDGEPANAADPLLSSIEDAKVRGTLIAKREGSDQGGSPPRYRFDIIMQGENETAFLEL